MSIVLLKTLAA